jgi:hypothetical protein
MEKIGLSSTRIAQPQAPAARGGSGAALLRAPAAGGVSSGAFGREGPRSVDPFPRSARPVFDDMFAFAMDGGGSGLMSVDSLATEAGGTLGERSGDSADALGDYEAMLDAGTSARQHDLQAGTPLFGSAAPNRIRLDAAHEGDAEQRLTAFEPSDESIEQFSITHPTWGLVEVDSRRSAGAWGVTVRCEEAVTRARLRSREPEFRDMLQRRFGVSLELDVQPVTRR